ncbi:hypothetical protein TGRUB_363040 [Toxoplasma gondii RUB]|uniref:Uncharacterized protein n=1 Tax=Toxoplasma gondii RUB TaxID=935652 RepID=A0A086LX27_TOXGO|nr:hypothetical protein TGRUB_363040 [Toxoplasma gondii RUB]
MRVPLTPSRRRTDEAARKQEKESRLRLPCSRVRSGVQTAQKTRQSRRERGEETSETVRGQKKMHAAERDGERRRENEAGEARRRVTTRHRRPNSPGDPQKMHRRTKTPRKVRKNPSRRRRGEDEKLKKVCRETKNERKEKSL